jgi:3-oxoacyl-[acyl-carrier protein] reductase
MKKLGFRPDAVVHNAGAAAMNHTLLTSIDSFRRLWEVNTLSAFLVGREAAKFWVREKVSGKLIFISTVAVPLALEGEAAYVAAKAGLEGLAMSWANEFKPLNIAVNIIGPGPVDTALWRSVPHDARAKLLERLQEPRLTSPEEIASACDELLLASTWRSGERIYFNLKP